MRYARGLRAAVADTRQSMVLPGPACLAEAIIAELAITVHHAWLVGEMSIAHKDPFDRLLIAQAQAEDMVLVSNEAPFDGFAVKRLW